MIMEIYHLAMCHNVPSWTLKGTAKEFECSIGLVSENLRLANAMHLDDKIMAITSRQDALKKLLQGKSNGKDMEVGGD